MNKIFTAAAVLLLSACLMGCAGKERKSDGLSYSQSNPGAGVSIEIAEGKELLCLAETRQEAEKTAEVYAIELVEFRNGVAVFHTEENPQEVIDRGIKNGWQELSLNTIQHLMGNS